MPAHAAKTRARALPGPLPRTADLFVNVPIYHARGWGKGATPLAPIRSRPTYAPRMEGAASPSAQARADKPLLAQLSSLGLLALLWLLVLTNVKLDPLPLFAFHPLLVSMGLYMLFQGMAALQKTRGQDEKARGLLRHQILLGVLGVPLITVGVYIMWHLHSKPGAKHFISWHGLLGALLLLALWLQGLFGLAVVYSPRMIFGSENRAKAMYKYHRYVSCMWLMRRD